MSRKAVSSAILLMAVLAALGLPQGSAAAPVTAAAAENDPQQHVGTAVQAPRRKLLGFRQCSLNGRHFEHFGYFGHLQCCNGLWHHGRCGGGSSWTDGSCQYEGQWYCNSSWNNGYQCCSGSWSQGGCGSSYGGSSSGSYGSSSSGSSDAGCSWQGQQYPSNGWCNGYQCCSGGSWSKGGCSS